MADKSQKKIKALPPSVERKAFTRPEFCAAHRISESLYYKLKREGKGPREGRAGTRVIISCESAEAWQREREQESAA